MRTILAGDIVLYGNDVRGKPRKYRVSSYVRRVEDPAYEAITAEGRTKDEFEIALLLQEELRKDIELEKAERRAAGLPASRRYTFEKCLPEEATHLCLSGICGAIAPLEQCVYIAQVQWSMDRIAEAQDKALQAGKRRERLFSVWRWE